MQVTELKLTDIKPYENNPRVNAEAVSSLARIIRDLGFRNPILVNRDHVIIAGHTRWEAVKSLGWETIPCIVEDDLTPDQERALRIADNKVAEIAEWDEDKLKVEMKLLEDAGFDLSTLAFQDDELDAILGGDALTPGETESDAVPEVPEVADSKPGEIYVLGAHRLLCGDATKAEDVKKLIGEGEADLWLTDPPYNVSYEGSNGLTIQNDSMEDTKFREFLRAAFGCAEKALKPGAPFYIFHADSEGYNFRGACHDVGLRVRQCLVWKKNALVLGRQDYQWIHEPCQPPGTMVRTPDGEKPIETLKDGDRVVAFDTYSGSLKGLRDGVPVRTASREYRGLMYRVSCGSRQTCATDNHEFSVRFDAKSKNRYCTYLMRRGSWWRVGHTRAYDARQFGLKTRFNQEKADAAWLIETYETRADAQVGEQLLACRYGIPYTHWETDRGIAGERPTNRTPAQIAEIYANVDLRELRRNALRLLNDYGRSERFPMIDSTTKADKFSTRVTCRVRACNLVPCIMELPVPRSGYGKSDGRLFDWVPIGCVVFGPYFGRVYSLSVPKWEHYIADGIVTHNCLYGWKDGAGHNWYGDRAQTTVMEYNKPKKNDVHPTMKPVEMMVYLLRNSTQRGNLVLDTFGGSGSTLIACEESGRVCRTMELDPKYCDVIRRRWAEFKSGEGCDWKAMTRPEKCASEASMDS